MKNENYYILQYIQIYLIYILLHLGSPIYQSYEKFKKAFC